MTTHDNESDYSIHLLPLYIPQIHY